MAKMKTGAPAQKVTFASAAAALATVIVSIFSDAWEPLARYQAEFVTVLTFLAGYLMPPSANDTVMTNGAES